MGILLDERYWAGACAEVWQLQPIPNRTAISRDQANSIRQLGCRVFTELLGDPELKSDVQSLKEIFESSISQAQRQLDFPGFFENFCAAERILFEHAGLHVEITRQILGEINEMENLLKSTNSWDARLIDQLETLQKVVCKAASRDLPELITKQQRVWQGFKACMIMAANGSAGMGSAAGGAILGGPFGAAGGAGIGMLAALSINSGRIKLVKDALRNAW